MTTCVKYPEHERLRTVREQSQAIGEFIDWLETEGIHLAWYPCLNETRGHDHVAHPDECVESMYLYLVHDRPDRLIAKFFDIDLDKIEAEKRAMLDEIRAKT